MMTRAVRQEQCYRYQCNDEGLSIWARASPYRGEDHLSSSSQKLPSSVPNSPLRLHRRRNTHSSQHDRQPPLQHPSSATCSSRTLTIAIRSGILHLARQGLSCFLQNRRQGRLQQLSSLAGHNIPPPSVNLYSRCFGERVAVKGGMAAHKEE